MQDAVAEFARRVNEEWLQIYCDDPDRRYSQAGFRPDSIKVTSIDAENCLRAIDSGLVDHIGGCRYRMPRSHTHDVLFWEGPQDDRWITLSMEPVITFASIARLHFDYGWPKECLGMQLRGGAFDLIGVLPGTNSEYLVGEVKRDVAGFKKLIRHLEVLCAGDGAERIAVDLRKTRDGRNSYNKWDSLRRGQASQLWAIGPGGNTQLFEVSHFSSDICTIREVSEDRLMFPAMT